VLSCPASLLATPVGQLSVLSTHRAPSSHIETFARAPVAAICSYLHLVKSLLEHGEPHDAFQELIETSLLSCWTPPAAQCNFAASKPFYSIYCPTSPNMLPRPGQILSVRLTTNTAVYLVAAPTTRSLPAHLPFPRLQLSQAMLCAACPTHAPRQSWTT
jgi:hypothetical protein